jgi:D-alanyl-D-alanine-carboxypeptidase/D-alanyl-D-alanine-endopeptidase
MKTWWQTAVCLVILTLPTCAQKPSSDAVISDAEIQQILAERIDQKRQSVGIVVGVIEDRGERIVSYGALNQNDPRPIGGGTTFELGGVTSVFTSLLLADMAQKGEVSLNDPLSKYLPNTVKVPSQGPRFLTLADLATHTAGLSLLPGNLRPKNPANPYAEYTEADLLQWLSTTKLNGTLGTDYSYSHAGMGLLALALAKRAGTSYEALLRARVLDPLGMKATGLSATPEMKAQFAVGHNSNLQPVANWDAPSMAGAVGMKSTAHDLLSFLESALGYLNNPLANSMAAMLNLRRPTRYAGLELALGWHVLTTSKNQIVWHNGGTGGFRAFIGFSPRTKVGIVVLSNTESSSGIEDIGLKLFNPTPPDLYFQREHRETKVDPRILANYVGDYQLSDGMLLRIKSAGDHLVAQLGQQSFTLSAESQKDFFVKNIEGQMTFVTDRNGIAVALVLHQAGTDLPAKRIR